MTRTLATLPALLLLAASAVVFVSCAGSGRATERPPDQQFGHRFDGKTSDGRQTIVIAPPDGSTEYTRFPAVYDTVHIRAAAPTRPDVLGVPVEVLVKGAFPDACTELNSVKQERAGHIISVELDMRRPRGRLCASVVRPYRFYLMLEGIYEPGHYTLKVNDLAHPLVIRPFDARRS